MIFTARYEGDIRGAWNVPFQEDAYCLECGERLRIWREFEDAHARHFRHVSNMGGGGGGGNGGCSGGESDDHRMWKNFAAERLHEIFENRAASRPTVEEPMAAPCSDKEKRAADACIFFENRDPQLGRGLAVEVQHRHKNKDTSAVERDYDRQGVATLWLTGDDFTDKGLPMNEVDIRHRVRQQTSICERCPKWELLPGGYSYAEQPATHERLIHSAHDPRDREAKVPATVVADWVLPTPADHWRSTPWRERFRSSNGNYRQKNLIVAGLAATLPACDRRTPATIPRHWYVPTPADHWRSTPWEERFRTVDTEYITTHQRGERTRIAVSIPPAIDTQEIERQAAMYCCSVCRWRGDEYLIADDGSTAGTAVCPNCAGGLRLASSVDAGMHSSGGT